MRTWTLCISIASLTLLSLAAAPAAAVDFSLFGSYLDTEDVDDGWGLGGRVAFLDRFQIQMTGTWYASFNQEVQGIEVDRRFDNKIDIIPIDIGGAWYFRPDASGLYIGAGGTYFLLSTDFGNIDDEFGWYAQIGYQLKGFYLEVLYRDAEGTIKDLPDDITTVDRTKVKLTGWGVNAGWRF